MAPRNPPISPHPAEGPPWDVPIEQAPLAIVDVETTGLDPRRHGICEIAIQRARGCGRVVDDELVSFVRTASPVGTSIRFHGIDDRTLEDAPALSDLAPRIDALFAGAIPVGHRVEVDLSFLGAAATRGEIAAPPPFALDTLTLARRAFNRPSYALEELARALSLPLASHRARADVIATRALLERVCEQLRPRTARHLWQVRVGERRASMRDDVRAALEAAFAANVRVRVCYRVPGRNPFVDELAIYALIPPRVEGWLEQTRVKRVLRGDRILWAEPTETRYETPSDFRPSLPQVQFSEDP